MDLFTPLCDFYARLMSSYLDIPREKMEVHPLGISLDGYSPRVKALEGSLKIGYFARVAPEKGLHVLAEAYRLIEREAPGAAVMEAAGYLGPEFRGYLKECQRIAPFTYHGTLDREAKQKFLAEIDVLSVPSPYADPKGTYLLEAMAAGTPFVQPRHGAFPEIAERTGGGVLVDGAEPRAIADGILSLIRNRERVREFAAAGLEGVRREYSLEKSAARAIEIYERVTRPDRVAAA